MTVTTEIQTMDVDGVEVRYTLAVSKDQLPERLWYKLDNDMAYLHARFRIGGKEYYFEMRLSKEVLTDVDPFTPFLKYTFSQAIKKYAPPRTR